MIQGTGRPISVRLPEDLVEALDHYAKTGRKPRSEVIRSLLESAILQGEYAQSWKDLQKPKPAEAGSDRHEVGAAGEAAGE